jgi:hypothetical protein
MVTIYDEVDGKPLGRAYCSRCDAVEQISSGYDDCFFCSSTTRKRLRKCRSMSSNRYLLSRGVRSVSTAKQPMLGAFHRSESPNKMSYSAPSTSILRKSMCPMPERLTNWLNHEAGTLIFCPLVAPMTG